MVSSVSASLTRRAEPSAAPPSANPRGRPTSPCTPYPEQRDEDNLERDPEDVRSADAPRSLSRLPLPKYVTAMRVAAEMDRILAPNRHCAVLIGDTRRRKHYVPLSVRVLEQFLDASFVLREDVIKLQHKMTSTRERWRGTTYDFYLIAHEHLYVFRKPADGEDLKDYRYSAKWR